MCACVHLHVCVCVCACEHVYVHACVCICLFLCILENIRPNMYVRMDACMHVYTSHVCVYCMLCCMQWIFVQTIHTSKKTHLSTSPPGKDCVRATTLRCVCLWRCVSTIVAHRRSVSGTRSPESVEYSVKSVRNCAGVGGPVSILYSF